MSAVSDINLIIDSAVLESFSPKAEVPFRSFGKGKNSISFQGEGARTFAIAVTRLFEGNRETCQTMAVPNSLTLSVLLKYVPPVVTFLHALKRCAAYWSGRGWSSDLIGNPPLRQN